MGKINKNIESEVRASVNRIFGSDPLFILGVSGGPDSMALLYLFHKLGSRVLVVHINYEKRGRDSDLDQELTEQMAFQWGFDCCAIRVGSEERKGVNFQNWAREKRYQAFYDLMDIHEADAIVTAHHQDDQIETILQKVLRGSSPAAWQGMKEWDENLFRPLINFTKEQILDYCEQEAIPYRIDESNTEVSFARNFMRHELSEKLDNFFPGWRQNILTLPRQGAMFEKSIDWITQQILHDQKLDLKKYSSLNPDVKAAVIKHIIDVENTDAHYTKGQLQEFIQLDQLQTGKSLTAGALVFTRNRDEIRIHRKNINTGSAFLFTKEDAQKGLNKNAVNISLQETKKVDSLNIDADKLRWPLSLRLWESGDTFQPLGMKGSQKISDHLTNRKIPASLKEKALVLCGSDGTIYATIYPETAQNSEKGAIADVAKFEDATRNFLTINIK